MLLGWNFTIIKKNRYSEFRKFRWFESEISKLRTFVRRFRSFDLDISTISVVRRRNFKVFGRSFVDFGIVDEFLYLFRRRR